MGKTWVVVADSSRARLFEQDRPRGPLQEIKDLANPRGRMKGSDLLSDSPGRAFDSKGAGRHAMSATTDVRRHEAEVFAAEIASQLDNARTGNKLQSLVIFAPPEFLGLLRDKMNEPTRELVSRTINKDLVSLKPQDILKYLVR